MVQGMRPIEAREARRTFAESFRHPPPEATVHVARRILPLSVALLACATGTGSSTSTPNAPRTDDLDAFVTTQMARRHVPGLSLAVIQDGRVVYARAYGVTDPGGSTPVTTSTLFQAGSISKSVAALGALHLVEAGKLPLDRDVNLTLTSWKVPTNAFTAQQPVTVRELLSHTAGLTVHGFPGYAVDEARPTLVQVLDSAPPTNTAAIRVDTIPGTIWRYSGGGYTVLQQMIIDVTGESFPEYMRRAVLGPIGMTSSSYEQPLPAERAAMTAGGQYANLRPVKGRWHIYPEMAAAGLWTTPTDLARFAIEVQQAYAGKSSKVISPATARQMLTEVKEGDGLGVFLQGTGNGLMFSHGGRDEGFDASLVASAATGQGLALMINANDNSGMVDRITNFVARKYGWPTASAYTPPVASAGQMSLAELRPYTGRYELSNNNMITFVAANGRLFTLASGLPDEEFVPVGRDQFASTDRNVRASFTRNGSDEVTGLTWTVGDRTRTVPRVGPLVSDLSRQADPDPAFTARLDAALRAMMQGGDAVANAPALTAGARRDFGRRPWPPVAGSRGIAYLGAQDVDGRNLERHDSPVARIAYYMLTTDAGQQPLLVYVTKDGLITDFDNVVN
jgi:CubicO group peptidase (beta-lactamase class C family)